MQPASGCAPVVMFASFLHLSLHALGCTCSAYATGIDPFLFLHVAWGGSDAVSLAFHSTKVQSRLSRLLGNLLPTRMSLIDYVQSSMVHGSQLQDRRALYFCPHAPVCCLLCISLGGLLVAFGYIATGVPLTAHCNNRQSSYGRFVRSGYV